MEQEYSRIGGLAAELVRLCSGRGFKVATAESCTGGMVSGALTSVPGSSAVIELGVCSYSNRIKTEILGVSAQTLRLHTEYSGECAEEMARGALRLSGADFAVSVTGVAGPTGGTENAPVGTVWISVCDKAGGRTERFAFGNADRERIRAAAAGQALAMLLENIKSKCINIKE